jgi:hypothetical protein
MQCIAQDPVESVEGSGNIILAQNGEEFTVTFDIRWKGDDAFGAQFYGPLGIPLASIRAITALRWILSLGDTQYVVHPSKNICIGRNYIEYQFSWGGLVEALTGRYPCLSDLRERPDSVYVDKKKTVLLWKSRRFQDQPASISASIGNKTGLLTEISYSIGGAIPFSLVYGDFKDRMAKEIKFIPANNNYFNVKFHTLTVRLRKAT